RGSGRGAGPRRGGSVGSTSARSGTRSSRRPRASSSVAAVSTLNPSARTRRARASWNPGSSSTTSASGTKSPRPAVETESDAGAAGGGKDRHRAALSLHHPTHERTTEIGRLAGEELARETLHVERALDDDLRAPLGGPARRHGERRPFAGRQVAED